MKVGLAARMQAQVERERDRYEEMLEEKRSNCGEY
jgi:hypothetical protein